MPKRFALALLTATLFAIGAGQANPLDPASLKLYGGTYSTNCHDVHADRVEVLADRLIFSSGNRELVARDILAVVSYWGNAPPDDFEIALIGEVEPDRGLVFLIYGDTRGLYILLDGHPDVLQDIGQSPGDETPYYMCASK